MSERRSRSDANFTPWTGSCREFWPSSEEHSIRTRDLFCCAIQCPTSTGAVWQPPNPHDRDFHLRPCTRSPGNQSGGEVSCTYCTLDNCEPPIYASIFETHGGQSIYLYGSLVSDVPSIATCPAASKRSSVAPSVWNGGLDREILSASGNEGVIKGFLVGVEDQATS